MESNKLNTVSKHLAMDGNRHSRITGTHRRLRVSKDAESVLSVTAFLWFPRHSNAQSNAIQVGAKAGVKADRF